MKDFSKFIAQQGDMFYFLIKAKTNADKNHICKAESDDFWILKIKAIPKNNQANEKIVKFFKKEFKITVSIISGQRDRIKLLKCEKI